MRARIAAFCANLIDLTLGELRFILTSFSVMIIIVAGNLLYAFFYPSPYLNDVLTKQKIAVVDEDKTQKSREFIFNANAQARTDIIAHTTMQSAQEMLRKNEIYGILYIPQDFEKNGIKSSVPKVYYIANNAYFLIYSSVLEGLNGAASAIDFKSAQMRFSGDSASAANADRDALKAQFNALFNPSIGYLNYILATVLVFILHQTIVIACGILCGTQIQQYNQHLSAESRESARDSAESDSKKSADSTQKFADSASLKTRGIAQKLANFKRTLAQKFSDSNADLYFLSAQSPIMLIFARINAFVAIYFPLFLFYFGFIYSFYNLTTFAQSAHLVAFGIAFIVATASFGTFLGFCFPRREYVPQITLVMSMPLLFGLGVIWPSQAIPSAVQFFMDFVPIRPVVSGFLKLNQMRADFSDIWSEFVHLLALAAIYACGAYLIVARRFKDAW